MLVKMWKKGNPCQLLVGLWNVCGHCRKQYVSSSKKIKTGITMWSSNPTSGYIPKRIESMISKRRLHTHVHRSFIHKGQEVEATPKYEAIYEWITGCGIYTWWNIIQPGKKKRGNPVTCYNIDASWGHNAKWNKPVMRGQILYWFHLHGGT